MIETMRQNYILGKEFQAFPTFLDSNFSWWAQCCHLCLKRSNSLWVRQRCKKAADFRLELEIKVAAKLRRHTISVAEEKSGSDWKAVSFGISKEDLEAIFLLTFGGFFFSKILHLEKYKILPLEKHTSRDDWESEARSSNRVNCIALNNHCRFD